MTVEELEASSPSPTWADSPRPHDGCIARSLPSAGGSSERAVTDHVTDGGALTLRLAMVGTLADSHIVDALRVFKSRFERATVELRTATSREIGTLVRGGEADLGLRYFADPDPKLESLPLGEEKLYVVVLGGHRVTASRLADLGERRRASTIRPSPPSTA